MTIIAFPLNLRPLQFHGNSEFYEKILRFFNTALTAVFTVESILKILAFGVRVSHLYFGAISFELFNYSKIFIKILN